MHTSLSARLRAEIDAQPKPQPGAFGQLLATHYGTNWRPGCTFADIDESLYAARCGADDEDETPAPRQGLAPISRAQRRAAWNLVQNRSLS